MGVRWLPHQPIIISFIHIWHCARRCRRSTVETFDLSCNEMATRDGHPEAFGVVRG